MARAMAKGVVLSALVSTSACVGMLTDGSHDGNGGLGPLNADGTTGVTRSALECRVRAPMKRLTDVQYRNTVDMLFNGKVKGSASFPITGETGSPKDFQTEPQANPVTQVGVANILEAAEEVALAAVEVLPSLLPCAAQQADEACALSYLKQYAARAYRRPPTSEEMADLLALFQKGSGADAFKDGIAAATAAMLQMPQFLYQLEIGTPVAAKPGLIQLTDYEVAARLSYLLWDSMPDEELFSAAAKGELQSGASIRAQAERMLRDPAAKPALSRFVREWSGMETPAPGERGDDGFTADVAASVQKSFDLFAYDAFTSKEPTLRNFLTGPSVITDNAMSAYYGFPTPTTAEANGFGRVPLDEERYAGLFTQPAFLAGLSSTRKTSYVRRGVFVIRKALCFDLPPAPPNAQSMVPAMPENPTQNERSAAIRKNPTCAGCHNLIDPIGLGFESYDDAGRFRTMLKPQNIPVPTGGEIVAAVSASAAGKFATIPELASKLADNSDVQQCVVKNWFRFTFARRENDGDSCIVSNLNKQPDGAGLNLNELVLALTASDQFRFRDTSDTLSQGE